MSKDNEVSNGAGFDAQERERLAAKVARRYYIDEVPTPELAVEFDVSRSTISRLISLARSNGSVRIEVRDPDHHQGSLSVSVSEKYGLTEVFTVLPRNPLDTSEEVARRAASEIKSLLHDDMKVGISWGSTIAAVSEYLTPVQISQAEVIQLFGAGSPVDIEVDYAVHVLERFTEAWNASPVWFPVPAFFDRGTTRDVLWEERSVQRVLAKQRSCDLAIFSVGSTTANTSNQILSSGFLDKKDTASLIKDGAVGDICSYFFDAHGSTDDIRINERSSGLDLNLLKKIPLRLCVASGRKKAEALLAALRGGYITHLIADAAILERVVELDSEK